MKNLVYLTLVVIILAAIYMFVVNVDAIRGIGLGQASSIVEIV